MRLFRQSLLRIKLHRLISYFQDTISSIKLDYNAVKRLHREMDRLTSAYRPAITIIEMLLEAEGISLDTDEPGVRLPGFLFDMNLFFQALLSRFLSEHLSDYDVRGQYTIKDMMTTILCTIPGSASHLLLVLTMLSYSTQRLLRS